LASNRQPLSKDRNVAKFVASTLTLILSWTASLTLSNLTFAIHGAGSVNLAPDNGWRAFEIVTQNDSLVGLNDVGYPATATRGTYDGLGTYVVGNMLSINVNHETSDAAISRVDVSISAVRQAVDSKRDFGATPFPTSFVTGMGYAYDRIYDGAYHAITNPNPVAQGTPAIVNYGIANFDRFCSGSSYVPNAFGPNRGLRDAMYITGEEVSGGKFYAIDQATRSMWEVPAFGLGSWENAAQVDTGNATHVAMLLNSDISGSAGDYLRLYVGRKGIDSNADGVIDFLERNGLRGGSVYHFVPTPPASATDLPDGTVSGQWALSTLGALVEDKLEDVHTNPLNGTQLVFADQTDGVYLLDTPLVFSGINFNPAASPVTITQIDNEVAQPLGNPDNLFWSRNGKIYVQEDGDGNEMWQIDENGGGHVRIAQGFSEPSGIIDVSAELGYSPGTVLLSSLQGGGSSGAQLVALVAPVDPYGDFNNDGRVNAADYVVWRKGLGTKYLPGDLNLWRSHFGQVAGGAGGHIDESQQTTAPEPASVLLVALVVLASFSGRRIYRRPERNS
jgi:hypothetical protein